MPEETNLQNIIINSSFKPIIMQIMKENITLFGF